MNDYLEHHGILGQKWGVRRYQNADGSLTEAGKKRYERQIKSSLKKNDRKIMRESYTVGLSAATKANSIKTNEAKANLYNDPEFVKANKKYSDAYQNREHVSDILFSKNNGELDGWSDVDEKRYRKAAEKEEITRKELNTAFKNSLKKHEGEILSAKLADIGQEDTEYGRQIIKSIYEKRGRNRPEDWWLYI